MFRKIVAVMIAGIMSACLAACGSSQASVTSAETSEETTAAEVQTTITEDQTDAQDAETKAEESAESDFSDETAEAEANTAGIELGKVDASLAEDKSALISEYADKFEELTYTDDETGLSITFNLYLPENYNDQSLYPLVVFIADSSCANGNASASLTQGRGALVWASEAWQAEYPTIVAVPTYPQTILDDHGQYTTTEYVELTKRFIDYMCSEYAVDSNRIYGTGQSMGCMTTLILSSEYTDLYSACMFVDGQWDVSTLTGLADVTFIYFAAEDDDRAWAGAQEVMSMFDADKIDYEYAQWDGNWNTEELSAAAEELFARESDKYFVSWASGTIESNGGMVHMASFDYAYNCVAVMEWLIQN